MPRPKKKGLAYFPKDTDYYYDFKIMDLLNEFGPLGQTIYDVTVTLVYREGYYLAIPQDKLASNIIRIIGNRWVKEKNLVLQVIHYCADIELFDKALLHQDVITSAGIQRRYAEVTVRNKVDRDMYWLQKDGQPCDSTEDSGINVTETPENVTKTPENVTETTPNKTKQNGNEIDTKVSNVPAELAKVFKSYLTMRSKIKKPATEEAIILVVEKLEKLAPGDYETQKAILNQSIMNSWQGVFPLKDKVESGTVKEKEYKEF